MPSLWDLCERMDMTKMKLGFVEIVYFANDVLCMDLFYVGSLETCIQIVDACNSDNFGADGYYQFLEMDDNIDQFNWREME